MVKCPPTSSNRWLRATDALISFRKIRVGALAGHLLAIVVRERLAYGGRTLLREIDGLLVKRARREHEPAFAFSVDSTHARSLSVIVFDTTLI